MSTRVVDAAVHGSLVASHHPRQGKASPRQPRGPAGTERRSGRMHETYNRGMAHSAESRRIRRELDKELSAAGQRSGQTLVWSAAEKAILNRISDTVDHIADLTIDYRDAADAKTRVKISTELRLLDASLVRLLKQIKTDVPSAESRITVKNRAAARARWDKASAYQ